jgi:hypothetical protein
VKSKLARNAKEVKEKQAGKVTGTKTKLTKEGEGYYWDQGEVDESKDTYKTEETQAKNLKCRGEWIEQKKKKG